MHSELHVALRSMLQLLRMYSDSHDALEALDEDYLP
jgi:hypothetical protein